HVRVVHPEDAHVGAAPRSPLLHRLGRRVEHAQEGHRARRAAARGVYHVVLRAEAGEREAGAAARLLDDRGRLYRLEDLLHRVPDRQHVAGGVLERVLLARIHQRGGVGQEVTLDHHVVEGGRDLPDRGRAPPEATLRGGDGGGDPPAHLLGGLPHLPLLTGEVPLAQDPESRLGPAAYLGRSCLGWHDVVTDFLPPSYGIPGRLHTCTWGSPPTISQT